MTQINRVPRKWKKELKKKLIKGTGYKQKECEINGLSKEQRHLNRSISTYKGITVRAYSLGFSRPWNNRKRKAIKSI